MVIPPMSMPLEVWMRKPTNRPGPLRWQRENLAGASHGAASVDQTSFFLDLDHLSFPRHRDKAEVASAAKSSPLTNVNEINIREQAPTAAIGSKIFYPLAGWDESGIACGNGTEFAILPMVLANSQRDRKSSFERSGSI